MKMEGMSETVNLFDCLVKANAIIFHYTTPDGRDEMVKFPLAGFCENYIKATFCLQMKNQEYLI